MFRLLEQWHEHGFIAVKNATAENLDFLREEFTRVLPELHVPEFRVTLDLSGTFIEMHENTYRIGPKSSSLVEDETFRSLKSLFRDTISDDAIDSSCLSYFPRAIVRELEEENNLNIEAIINTIKNSTDIYWAASEIVEKHSFGVNAQAQFLSSAHTSLDIIEHYEFECTLTLVRLIYDHLI